MKPADRHLFEPDVGFDGGNLDCGSGLLLMIRKAIDPLRRGGLLEIRSTESSVEEDLPSWCRMTGNELVSWTRAGAQRSFLVCKGALRERSPAGPPVTGADVVPPQVVVPVRIPEALPGPYLLTRTMWLECVSDRAYDSRESLAEDIVRVLREELHFLLAAGASLVQFDEPVLSEVVFTGAKKTRSFMCGALSEKKDASHELAFAADLLNRVVEGVVASRTAVHICRGN